MEVVIGLTLFAVTVLGGTLLARRLRIQGPLVLLAIGVLGSYLPFVHEPTLSPELVLVGILPPLLYAAAVNTSLVDFRDNLSSIGWLSVGLVLFTAVGVGLVVWRVLGVPFAAAFAIGAVVAPPDAVAATAVARQIGLPRRVVTVLEGESLVNDATALVSLRSAVAALAAPVSAVAVGLDFAKAVGLAILVGLVVAKLGSMVFRRISDPLVTTILTFLVPFLAYAPAEELHASGVLAVVVAGLFIGHHSQRTQTAQGRLVQRLNWATIQFLLENSVFLLVGLQVHRIVTDGLTESSPGRLVGICGAVLATVIALRVVWIGFSRLWLIPARRRGRESRFSWQESMVTAWAGMRGVVTLAAALTLPVGTPMRATLILVALTTTIGTLVLQGLTLPALARRLGVHGPDPREDALQEATVLQAVMQKGLTAAHEGAGPSDKGALNRLEEGYANRVNAAWERLGRSVEEVATPSDAYRRLRLVALGAERAAVLELRSGGQADQEVLARVLAALDMEESMLVRIDEREQQQVSAAKPLAPALAEAPCEHLAHAPGLVPPSEAGHGLECHDCRIEGTEPVHLRMCLSCGTVGCCDSSEGRHSERHFRQTGHPVMRSVEPGESWRWCYLDEVLGG
ncbi:Na+/H+ antiporter [Naumannella sp. ID2617S]|uniref:Na+/H+ antiporter n=1 Tax=Enemella dayhoffiae TaxID=2016507 RepID=A0A255H3V8_9ACTN|nr:Na+/H+ antiporter [Enemella dayhoffiae]NNG18082.1 Na+/H+ antiporter [Naumannella sp. ID2617S]OYO21254.1 Na+/H+ antiporter [Enemella dayhoffiae]